jgi:excisionase family DNA binding protein
MLSTKKAAHYLGVHEQTLRRWEKEGKVSSHRLESGQRRYTLRDLDAAKADHKSAGRTTIIYCRVSSKKQQNDLERQIQYMQTIYPDAEVISDISSGITYERPGMQKLLERIMQGTVATVATAHKDVLSRFNVELFETVARNFGTKVVVTNNQDASSQQELAEDIVAIIASYTTRLHGLRKYKIEVGDLLDQGEIRAEENYNEVVHGVEKDIQRVSRRTKTKTRAIRVRSQEHYENEDEGANRTVLSSDNNH